MNALTEAVDLPEEAVKRLAPDLWAIAEMQRLLDETKKTEPGRWVFVRDEPKFGNPDNITGRMVKAP